MLRFNKLYTSYSFLNGYIKEKINLISMSTIHLAKAGGVAKYRHTGCRLHYLKEL